MSGLAGVTIVASPYVPEGTMMMIGHQVLYHERVSVRVRHRKPHGRTNGPRRRRVRRVRYRPDYDRLMAMVKA